jgi:membrane protein YdbS with pleckstrin-like domain
MADEASAGLPDATEPGRSEWSGDGALRQLDPRFVDLARRRRFVVSAVMAAALLPVPMVAAIAARSLGVLALGTGAWVAVVLLLAWQAYSWPPIAYRHSWYRLSDRGLEIRRGVLFRSIVNVPRSRVQHTDVSQGPVERSFGLGRLVVFTAGSSFARVELQGLDHETALKARDFLLHDEARSDAV